MEIRIGPLVDVASDGVSIRLPPRLKADKPMVRVSLLKRLAANRHFAYGGRAGALRTAANRSGRPFRLDLRQRVVVKALVSRHQGRGADRGAALARHVTYLLRRGAGLNGAPPAAFDAANDGVDAQARASEWAAHRHHFRFIVSPEHGDRIHDLRDYAREVMRRVCADLGEPSLPWMAVCHHDTDQPHIHVLIPGRRADGRDLVIPRQYVGYGFRARAQEVAQERLGELSRHEGEQRIWRETRADRLTAFDRRLIAKADAGNWVPDALGGDDVWSALTRGRLTHLEKLGLAERLGAGFTLAPDMADRLQRLQASRDIIRSMNQWRVQSASSLEVRSAGKVAGRLLRIGFTDELGAGAYAIVREAGGADVYCRLAPGLDGLKVGKQVALVVDDRGLGSLAAGRRRGLER